HDLGVVANVADEVVVIYHGQIMEAGPVETIFRRPEHPYLKGLMAAAPHFDMKPGERLKSLREIHVHASALLGPGGGGARGGQGAQKDRALLTVRNLTKTYRTQSGGFFGKGAEKEVRAVDDVSFDIRRGECLGLVGESGSGKTSVSKLLVRAITADAG
ncbi:ATP-binding cassette domain-containing protein, partial [Thioclava sp. BHET1]